MELGLNEAQQMLKNSAQEFLETECTVDYVRAMEIDENGDISAAGIWENDEYLDQSILGGMDKWLDKYE